MGCCSLIDFEYEFDFVEGCEFTTDEFSNYCENFEKNQCQPQNQSIVDHGFFEFHAGNARTSPLQLPSHPNDDLSELLDLIEEIIGPQMEIDDVEEEICCEIVPYDDNAMYLDDDSYSYARICDLTMQ